MLLLIFLSDVFHWLFSSTSEEKTKKVFGY